jgi:hypothetical protein
VRCIVCDLGPADDHLPVCLPCTVAYVEAKALVDRTERAWDEAAFPSRRVRLVV